MDNGFGFGTVLLGILGGTGLGLFFGQKRGAKKAGERWHDALLKCAETGLPTGSDLNEAERKLLFGALKKQAAEIGEHWDDDQIAEILQAGAQDIAQKSLLRRFVTGETKITALFKTLGGTGKEVGAA